jgi:outer membrane protein
MPFSSRALTRIALASAVLAASAQAWAQRAGDVVLGAGILTYAPQDKSSPLRFTSPVQREIPGSGSDLHSATTLGLNVHYFLTDNWAVEGVFGIPPRLKLSGAGTLGGIGELGTTRLYGPSVLAKYFFGQPTDKLRISAGLGITYARFSNPRLSQGLQNALGGAIGIPPGGSSTSADIDHRFGPVFNLGANYAISDTLGVTLSVSYIPMKTTANLTTTAGGRTVAQSQAKLTLNPLVPFIYLTHKF